MELVLIDALGAYNAPASYLSKPSPINKYIKDKTNYYSPELKKTSRSEGFARAAYFVPGRDGVGVGQDSRILPAPSLTNIR